MYSHLFDSRRFPRRTITHTDISSRTVLRTNIFSTEKKTHNLGGRYIILKKRESADDFSVDSIPQMLIFNWFFARVNFYRWLNSTRTNLGGCQLCISCLLMEKKRNQYCKITEGVKQKTINIIHNCILFELLKCRF